LKKGKHRLTIPVLKENGAFSTEFLGWWISEMIRLFQKKAKVIFIKIEAAEKHLSGQFFSSI